MDKKEIEKEIEREVKKNIIYGFGRHFVNAIWICIKLVDKE